MTSEMELLETDITRWVMGPYHVGLPGPMQLKLALDGEIVVGAEAETGFLHRGLEKTFELHGWQAAISYADRVDPEGALFGEWALCMAVEEIAEIPVPARAHAIRTVLAELTRLSAHLGYIARMSRAVGAETAFHYVVRDREKILDLFELLTGVRFAICFLRYGGVCADVTEGFIERTIEVCDLFRVRLKEYNDLFTYNHAFLRRTRGVGTIGREAALRMGLTGPNGRASGLAFDVRRAHPHGVYERINFEPVVMAAGSGDCHDRFLVRLREISESVSILKQLAENIPDGEFLFPGMRVERGFAVPAGEAYARVESSRGLLGCHVAADGAAKPARVQFRVPSSSALLAVPTLLRGACVEDIPVILASLDICIAECDR